MASNTKITDGRRVKKVRAQGKARKKAMRKGSTPPFPIHKEEKKAD